MSGFSTTVAFSVCSSSLVQYCMGYMTAQSCLSITVVFAQYMFVGNVTWIW
jgi:hypothetical protein